MDLRRISQTIHGEENVSENLRVPLKTILIDQGFCDVLKPLLQLPDHDSREKVVFAMLSLYDCCESTLHSTLSHLSKLQVEYLALSTIEEDGDYFQHIHKYIYSLVQQLTRKEEL